VPFSSEDALVLRQRKVPRRSFEPLLRSVVRRDAGAAPPSSLAATVPIELVVPLSPPLACRSKADEDCEGTREASYTRSEPCA
jgi:hypothetical protein